MADDLHRVLVIFGSKSDYEVYDEILGVFANKGIEHDLRIASAHRTPRLVEGALAEKEYTHIISGAGLAAALPGVIASKTIKPVIGVPCSSNYKGLDALLSIMQMPPGIPVMAVGVNNGRYAALSVLKMLNEYDYINIIGDSENERIKRAVEMVEQFDQEFKISADIDKEAVNIIFIQLGDAVEETDALAIYCPLSKDEPAEAALNLLGMTRHGLWVGLNRSENATLAALQIINSDGRHDETFGWYRQSLQKNVEASNKPKQ